MAAEECPREVRKRRERRDSGSAHERKERRAPSEERPQPPAPPPPAPPLHDYNRIESERRAERLYRARRPQHKKRAPRPRPDALRAKENDLETEMERPSSPFIECGLQKSQSFPPERDPALQRAEGPQRSPAAERARPHDARALAVPGVPARARDPAPERRLERMGKKINMLKKEIAAYEADFRARHGHAASPSERITDVALTRMHDALRRLKEEKRCLKLDPAEYAMKTQAARAQKERDDRLEAALNSDKTMVDIVKDIEEWLDGWRRADGRDIADERSWSSAQLAAEKRCVQRALLRLEAARGRPQAHSAERGAARHLYERYRNVKRALAVLTSDAVLGSASSELCTIHEHEMLSSAAGDSSGDEHSDTEHDQDTVETPLQSPPAKPEEEGSASSAPSASEEAVPSNEGLHYLSLEDLRRALTETKVQKLILRRTIKDYETRTDLKVGRKTQREACEEDCARYKAVKARIRLLNALINKQKYIS